MSVESGCQDRDGDVAEGAAQSSNFLRGSAKADLVATLKELQQIKSHMEVAYDVLCDVKIKHFAHMSLGSYVLSDKTHVSS